MARSRKPSGPKGLPPEIEPQPRALGDFAEGLPPTGVELDSDGLRPKQRIFALEYLASMNAGEAALKAGYGAKLSRVRGHQLLQEPAIKRFVAAALRRHMEAAGLDVERVLREIQRVALVDVRQAFGPDGALLDVHEMHEDVARAIAAIETEEIWEGFGNDRVVTGHVKRVKFWDKVRGLELLGKYFGILDKAEDTRGLSNEERLKRLGALLEKSKQRALAASTQVGGSKDADDDGDA